MRTEPVKPLAANLTTEFHATTPNELATVETMAFCRWRILRSWTFRASQISREQRLQGDWVIDEDPPTQSVIALNSLNQPPSLLETLSRLEIRFDRQYHRAADSLNGLKKDRLRAKKGKKAKRSRASVENKAQLR